MLMKNKTDNQDKYPLLEKNGKPAERKKGVSIVWKDLSVTAEIKETGIFKKTTLSYKKIIDSATSAIFPGKLVALMGASGSGKTTLMSVLADRYPSGFTIEGDIKLSSKSSSRKFLRQISGFVYQHDLFIPTITVVEHLTFTAKLRLDRNTSDKERKKLILEILKEVGLSHLEHRMIGNPLSEKGKGSLSGGERKRLSVATELLTQPLLLFCDEPTTGLDSSTALQLLTTMQNMVISKNRTIVCSIHQPNRQIFDLFSQIILMSSGKILFNGSSSDALQFFENHGYQYDQQNPAEFLIKSIANSHSETNLDLEFFKSVYGQNVNQYVQNVMKQTSSMDCIHRSIQLPYWCEKLGTVAHRSFLGVIRNSSVQNVRIFQKFLLAILLGLCLRGSVRNTQPGLRAFQAAVFVMTTQNFFPACQAVLAHIPGQLPIFFREYSNNSCTPLIFYLSNVISLLPGFIFEALSYTLVLYILIGLQLTWFAMTMTCIVVILLLNITVTFGMFMSVFCKTEAIASSFSIPILNCCLICCGLFVKLSSLPFIISWIKYVSWLTYACTSLYIIQFKDVHNIKCDSNQNVRCLRNGHEVLASFNFDENSLHHNIFMMALIYFGFNLSAYIALLFKIKNRSV